MSNELAQIEGIRRAQLATARSQKRAGRLLWAVAILVLAMLVGMIWQGYDLARREIQVYTTLASTAHKEGHFDRAMRYALQAYPARGSFPWLTPFSTELEAKLAGGALLSPLHRVLNHSGGVNTVEFSRDGNLVLTASRDSTAALWSSETGNQLASFSGHDASVVSASLSQNGSHVLTILSDYSARLWDANQRKELAVLAHDGPVRSGALSLDGKRAIMRRRRRYGAPLGR